ncbi:MAG: SRPBCC family protein [Planctomycetota bacterium]
MAGLFKKLFIAVLVLVVLLLIVGFLLPAQFSAERSLTIKAPAAKVFPHVNRLKSWEAWSPWNTEKDPTLKFTYAGPEEGIGASYDWEGDPDTMGTGTLKITKSEPNKLVEYTLIVEGFKGIGRVQFAEANGETTVTWTSEADAGSNVLFRFFGLFYDSMLGPFFEEGLASLKGIAEGTGKPKAGTPENAATPENAKAGG